MADTYPMQASALEENGFLMLKGHPCKIVDMTTSTSGKHGNAKIHFRRLDIFTGEEFEDITPSTSIKEVPHVVRKKYLVSGACKENLKLPDNDLGKEIQAKFVKGSHFVVTVLKACGKEQVIGGETSEY